MSRKISGIVTSDVQDKTIVVTTTTRKTHPIYGKSYTVTKKFAAHDEKNQAKIGDKVIIAETKPISKNKSFILDQIVERGHQTIEIKKTAIEEEAEAKLAEKEAKKAAEKETVTMSKPAAVIASTAKQSSEKSADKAADQGGGSK